MMENKSPKFPPERDFLTIFQLNHDPGISNETREINWRAPMRNIFSNGKPWTIDVKYIPRIQFSRLTFKLVALQKRDFFPQMSVSHFLSHKMSFGLAICRHLSV